MSAIETALIFVGIPLVVVFGVYAIVVATSRPATPRYRPGRRMEFSPVWFLAPVASQETGLPALPAANGDGSAPVEGIATITGGAHGSW